MTAPFLKEKFRWIDSDLCWWCTRSRQTREHLFKECSTWKQEIRKLWKDVGEATSGQGERVRKRSYKGRKGFGLGLQAWEGGRVRGPGNTSVGTLLADERCIPAVLSFLENTGCGQVKEGIIVREGNSSG